MWGHKRRRREAEARELQLLAQLREERRKHAEELETERHAKLTACRQVERLVDQVADLLPAVTRLAGRNTALSEQLEELRESSTTAEEYILALETRLVRLQRAAGRYLGALWAARTSEEVSV